MIDAPTLDLRSRFDAAPMSGTQLAAVAVTVVLSALDGYDVLSVTFAAPAIAKEWGLGKAALGALLSAGLGGMAVGSLVLAPLADLFGRQRLVIASLILMAAGMFLSGFSTSLHQLILWRAVTGIGIGAMVAVINPLAAEFANARRRALALSLMAMGYPLGGFIGGLVAALLLRLYQWPTVFFTGAVTAAILILPVILLLPEPLAFLLARRRPDTLARVNALLNRCRLAPVAVLPPLPARSAGYAAVFAAAQLGTTVRVTLANLFFVVAVYYVLSWLPQIVVEAGFPPATASLIAAIMNLAGIAGGVALGVAARWAGLNRLTVTALVGLGLATTAFGLTPASLPLLATVAGICGFFLVGGIAGLYATFAASFTVEGRASGSGFVIGVGRIGSAIAPLLAGWLFAAGLSHATVSAAFGTSALLAGIILLSEHRKRAMRVPDL